MKKIKVLIVDDNKEIANFIKLKLERFELIDIVAVCFSSEDEKNLIDRLKPDIVITDIVRNGKESGFEIIKMYRKFLYILKRSFYGNWYELLDKSN